MKILITFQRTKFGFKKHCKKTIKFIKYFYIRNSYRKLDFNQYFNKIKRKVFFYVLASSLILVYRGGRVKYWRNEGNSGENKQLCGRCLLAHSNLIFLEVSNLKLLWIYFELISLRLFFFYVAALSSELWKIAFFINVSVYWFNISKSKARKHS